MFLQIAGDRIGVELVLVDFHIWIDFSYEETRSDVPNSATNDSKRSTEQCHVSKVKCGLEQTVHSVEMKKGKISINFRSTSIVFVWKCSWFTLF